MKFKQRKVQARFPSSLHSLISYQTFLTHSTEPLLRLIQFSCISITGCERTSWSISILYIPAFQKVEIFFDATISIYPECRFFV
jgi:hypothetical protein